MINCNQANTVSFERSQEVRKIMLSKSFLSLLSTLVFLTSPVFAEVSQQDKVQALDLYNESVRLINAGDFATAEAKLSQANAMTPDDTNILCNYGLALMKMGKLPEAKQALTRALQIKPNYDLCWLNLGLVQEGLGDLASARASLAKFVQLAPNNPYSDRIRAHLPEIDKLLASGVSPESMNMPDYVDELSKDQRQRWSESKMPIKIYLRSGDGIPGYKQSYGKVLESALNDWIQALGSDVQIVRVDNPQKADIVVKWTNDLSAGVNRSEGGDVRYVATADGIQHADITLLTLDPSPTVRLNDSLVYWISLHELGHGLGIVGHSRNPGDVMYFAAPQKVNPKLSSRDIQTIKRLYSEHFENWMTINEAGIKLMREQKFDQALEKFYAALKLNPEKSVIKTNIIITEENNAIWLMNRNILDGVEPHFLRALDMEEEVRDKNLDRVLKNYASYLTRVARASEIPELYKRFESRPADSVTGSNNANPAPSDQSSTNQSNQEPPLAPSFTPTNRIPTVPGAIKSPPAKPGIKPATKPGIKPAIGKGPASAKPAAGAKKTTTAVVKPAKPAAKKPAVKPPTGKPTISPSKKK